MSGYAIRAHATRRRLEWALIGALFTGLLAIVAAPYWLPAIRWFIPDRYIMAYAPDHLQPIIFQIDVDEKVPTPDIASGQSAAMGLLDSLAPTPTLAPVAIEGAQGGPVFSGDGYIQPTRVPVEPTPTTTPPPTRAISSYAVDRNNQADLSRADFYLTGFTFQQQTGSNNCGPASIATMMSYWGIEATLEEARAFLKPSPSDPNVRPDEMATYVGSFGYEMLIREGGDFDLLKRLILAGYPVLIETGYDPEPETMGWTSHFLTLVGFSERDGGFIAMDTYRRPNWFYPYEELDHFWRQFNRRYMVAYRPDQLIALTSIVGDDMDEQVNLTHALDTARFELTLDRNDPYGWFNLGTTLTALGRYDEAVQAFDEARRIGLPWRFLWYQFAPFEAYMQVGRYEDVITLANAVLAKIETEEPYYYMGLAYAGLGNTGAARINLDKALRFNRRYDAARHELEGLGDG
jgi:hypothetical protein